MQCRCCKQVVDVHDHECYLQREKTPEELREERCERRRQSSRAHRGAAAGLQTVRADEPSTSAADLDFDDDESVPPLHVFFDIVPNLVMAETDCIQSYLQWLDTLTLNGKRPLTVLAHHFRGYDSYPVIEELHRQKRQLEQVRNGGTVL